MEVNFPKLNHFWMDSGLLGLYEIAKKEHPEAMGIEIQLNDDGVLFKGTESNLDSFFNKTYDYLLAAYYNTSTEKQKEENAGFYYDSEKDKFVRFPKVKSMGIAGLIFNKAPRKTKNEIKYVTKEFFDSGKKIKRKVLPDDYAHLQGRFDEFLTNNKFKIGPSISSLLKDGRNAYQPKVDINVKPGKEKGNCFMCGEASHSLSEIGGTVYPMISGSSGALSFNSIASKPENVCWKCDFIGKFVPVNGFYSMNGGDNHIYLPYSTSLEKMDDVYESFQPIKIDDPKLLTNFDNRLGGYYPKQFEQFFAFLYTLYKIKLSKDTSKDDESELDFDKLYGITLSNAPLEFFVVHTEAFGKTHMGKMIWPFQDSVYLFRLLGHIEKNKINMKEVMRLLIDFDQKQDNRTIVRNRICERILKKQSVVGLIEQHVFRINKSKSQYIKPLNDFVIIYEKILKDGGTTMEQATIDTAVSLGKTIGRSISPSGRKGKGDLFKLRKARKPEDFLNEINRIQMKYDVLVTADLYNKGQEFEDNFIEFKHFCMIAALNTFNAGNKQTQTTEGNTN
jgi:hypothetical protein